MIKGLSVQNIIKKYLKRKFNLDIKNVYINKSKNGYDVQVVLVAPPAIDHINVTVDVANESEQK